MNTTDLIIIEAKHVGKSACWIVPASGEFKEQTRTAAQAIAAAGAQDFQISYGYDMSTSMRGTRTQVNAMRALVDKAWELAQKKFGYKDDPYRRVIVIDVALARKYNG